MISNISERIIGSLVDAGTVPSEEKSLYEYGIRMGILVVINVATTVLIGFVLGMVWQSIIFLLAYNPIRSYAGGYHSRTQLTCYLMSIPIIVAALLGIKLIPWNGYVCMTALISVATIIAILAPVEDSNKPLNEREKAVYKGRARAYSAVFFGAAMMLWFAGFEQISLSIIMALLVAAVMLVIGAIKNRNLIKEKA